VPAYDAFMDLVQPSDGVQRFIDDWDGYSLTGDASEQALCFTTARAKTASRRRS
jgi:putative DNA primase/helicase